MNKIRKGNSAAIILPIAVIACAAVAAIAWFALSGRGGAPLPTSTPPDSAAVETPEPTVAPTPEATPELTLAPTQEQMPGPTEKPLYFSEYAGIVQIYQDNLEKAKDASDIDDVFDERVNLEFTHAAFADYFELDHASFMLYDLNGDGTPELFIGFHSEGWSDMAIYDVYTYSGGKPVRLMDNLGYRGGNCIICENGVIQDAWSGSAATGGINYHVLPPNAAALETIESISMHGDMSDSENPLRFFHDYDGAPENEITEAEYNEIEARYRKVTGLKTHYATPENIALIISGEIEITI